MATGRPHAGKLQRRGRYLLQLAVVSAAYTFTAKLGIALSVSQGVVTPVWPPTGIALAAVLLGGRKMWPGIAMGAFIGNVTSGASPAASLLIATGNTLEALVGAHLLRRVGHFDTSMSRVRDVFSLSVWGAMVATIVAATIGTTALAVTGEIAWSSYASHWGLWWFGDAMGAVIVGPFVLVWADRAARRRLELFQITEATLLGVALFAAGGLVLFGRPWTHPYALFPLLIWASLRFRQRGAATAVFVIFCITIWATLAGTPPIVGGSIRQSLLWLQAWVAVVGVATLTLAAAISEREQAEAALRASEETFRTVFESAATGIARTDPEGRYIKTNAAYRELVGYSETELSGMRFTDVTHPDDLPLNLERFEALLAGQIPSFQIEKRYRQKNGGSVWVRLSVSVVRDPWGRPKFVHAVCQDISDRKRAEEESLRRAQELARSNGELEQFAYVASHDLQEPLRTVTSFVQLLERRYKGQLDEEADVFIGHAVDGAARMKLLIEDLLIYSRVGQGGHQVGAVDMGRVVAQAVDYLWQAVEESGARIDIGSMPIVMGNPVELGQVVQNLVANAIKYRAHPAPHVGISSRRAGNGWVVEVADDGIGIAPEFTSRIFGVFKRLHTPSEYPGTGIGLAICKKIVEAHGGRIWATSTPGHGSTFSFTVPAARGS